MTFTILFLVICNLVLIGSTILQAWSLALGLRWAKAEEAPFRKALLVVVASSLLGACIYLAQQFAFNTGWLAEELLFFAIQIGLWLFLLRLFFATGVFQSIKASVPLVLLSIAMVVPIVLIFQPFIAEGFLVPTNSMAPTIVGEHQECLCDKCNNKAYARIIPAVQAQFMKQNCICDQFHSTLRKERLSSAAKSGDRVVSLKFLRAQRWELATFKNPANPGTTYVMRVVGLPGESIHIEDNAVFVNGQRQAPPEHLQGLEYRDSAPGLSARHGTKENPAVLGEDEYFVLGDFADVSFDSRFWKTGAPGHNPYAVPESYMTGVVTTIYWPPERWRSFK